MTYTLPQIAEIFGVMTETIRRRWKHRYPAYFVEVVHGGGQGKKTEYEAAPINKLKRMLDELKGEYDESTRLENR